MNEQRKSLLRLLFLGVASIQAIIGLLVSLYFSEFAQYNPCELCWYQRICPYPLAIILPIAFLSNDKRTFLRYASPLVGIGMAIAGYHTVIYYMAQYRTLHPGSFITTCALSGPNSCTTPYITWFGFISIPLLSLVAFIIIAGCLIGYRRLLSSED